MRAHQRLVGERRFYGMREQTYNSMTRRRFRSSARTLDAVGLHPFTHPSRIVTEFTHLTTALTMTIQTWPTLGAAL
jgi:hypothetical protein